MAPSAITPGRRHDAAQARRETAMGHLETLALAIAGVAGLWAVARRLGDALERLADALDRLEDGAASESSRTGRR